MAFAITFFLLAHLPESPPGGLIGGPFLRSIYRLREVGWGELSAAVAGVSLVLRGVLVPLLRGGGAVGGGAICGGGVGPAAAVRGRRRAGFAAEEGPHAEVAGDGDGDEGGDDGLLGDEADDEDGEGGELDLDEAEDGGDEFGELVLLATAWKGGMEFFISRVPSSRGERITFNDELFLYFLKESKTGKVEFILMTFLGFSFHFVIDLI